MSPTESRSQTEASSDWLELPFSQAGDVGPADEAPEHPGAWEVSAKVCLPGTITIKTPKNKFPAKAGIL